MFQIPLSTLSILLGLGYLLPQIYGLIFPEDFRSRLRRFPRSLAWGVTLTILATIWFLLTVVQAQREISDFAAYTPLMLLAFGGLGLATCLVLPDFLSVRGFAVLLLLLAKLMVDNARWEDSAWRLVIVTWAYLWILGGMWFTVSPWRVRDLIMWKTSNNVRLRWICGLRTAFALLVIGLGLFVF